MVETRLHFGGFDRGDLVRAEPRCQLDPAVALRQPDKILVGQQHGARAAVLGDDDRVADRGILIGAKVFRDSGGGDGGGHLRDSFVPEYTGFPGFPQASDASQTETSQ